MASVVSATRDMRLSSSLAMQILTALTSPGAAIFFGKEQAEQPAFRQDRNHPGLDFIAIFNIVGHGRQFFFGQRPDVQLQRLLLGREPVVPFPPPPCYSYCRYVRRVFDMGRVAGSSMTSSITDTAAPKPGARRTVIRLPITGFSPVRSFLFCPSPVLGNSLMISMDLGIL